ncbi:unnamed protein product [Adineta steineri]|uniref:NAD(P)(+)--arginine ADP-ribosyltransferase n=1 Tax=Adineta steineri TaxID=433720 RepID=A0A819VZU9_9BILA|nr:unnamed protein product [Adineta steineri]CAF4115921.1 unnamed protein product [Adineta steineri]
MATGSEDEYFAQRLLRLTDIPKEPMDFLMPISGYEEMPIVSLEEALEPLVHILPRVKSYARTAKNKCKQPADNLTQDESASIMLYSMGWEPSDKCLYCALNATLRSKNRTNLKPWFLFLRLFLGALFRLPPIPHLTVFRGVKLDLSKQFEEDETFIWWGFSSCTTSIKVLQSEQFLGMEGTRTMFTIHCNSARDIRKHSYFPSEDEVLLLAATEFQVKGILNQGHGLRIIQLQEVHSDEPMLIPVSCTSGSADLSAGKLKNLKVEDDVTESETISKQAVTTTAASSPKVTDDVTESKIISKQTATTTAASSPKVEDNANESKIISQQATTTTAASSPKVTDDVNESKIISKQVATTTSVSSPEPKVGASEPKFNTWKQNGITVAGGNGQGKGLDQLNSPFGIYIDKKKNIFIADCGNHRIVKWNCNAKKGQIIAGGNGVGYRIDQLNLPTDVIIDQRNHSVIIADHDDRRVIRWLNQKQQILIRNINCYGLVMGKHGFLYVSDDEKNEVRRWKMGEYNNEGIVVAGGNGRGDQLNQLNTPTFIFVDEDQSLYVSDKNNHRVMKWRKDAKEGVIVAGGNGKGANLNQLSHPQGVLVDDLDQIYVADVANDRIMRWCEGKEEGEIVVGGNGEGNESNQLNGPMGLSFDDERNLYVVDWGNHRIQKFEIIL